MTARFTTPAYWRIYLLLLLLTVVGGLRGWAQHKPAADERVTNIRLSSVNQTSLEILYDLAVSNPGDSVYFAVTGRKSGPLVYSPGFVEGDFGRHVVAGTNRRIVWNVLANGYELNEEIRVQVLVKAAGSATSPPAVADSTLGNTLVVRPYRPGGPLTALLSVLVPGLGNVFVQRPKPKIGFRPLLTVGVATAIAYGLNQHQQAEGQYRLYAQQKNAAEGEPYYQQANQQQHRYFLATRAAAAIWLGDVVFTLIRGLQNRSLRRENNPGPIQVRPGYQGNTPVAAFTLRF